MNSYYPATKQIALEAGITHEQARIAAAAVLRELHQCAVVNDMGLTGAIMGAYFELGEEACYHFVGILEEQRCCHDSDDRWSETMMRFAPDTMQYYDPIFTKWVTENGGRSQPIRHQ